MMRKYLLFALLPSVVYSRIIITIKPSETVADASVDFRGSDLSVISDTERKTFRLDDETLKRATEKIKGRRCDNVYLKPPTPWGDVYEQYRWDVTLRILKPFKARVIGISSKPVAVASAQYINNHHKVDVSYSTAVTQQVEETVEHTWSSGGELSVGQEINYGVNFGAASVGGATSLSYSSTWGEDKTEARTVTLGTTSSVLVTIPPGEKVIATLTASQGTMDVEVSYRATLTNGDVFCNYANTYKGHHFYAFALRGVQKREQLPLSITYTEKISVGFYTSASIEVTNGTTHEEIGKKQAGIMDAGEQEEF